MKTLKLNSPEAAARLIALAVMADGRLVKQEIAWLKKTMIYDAVGIDQDAFLQIFVDFCRELVSKSEHERVYLLDERRLARMAAEIDDPALRKNVLSAMLVLAKSDGKLAIGEEIVLSYLLKVWQINLDELGA